jgi:hypothetical protein
VDTSLPAVLAMIRDEQLRRGPSVVVGRAGAISATPDYFKVGLASF